MVVFLAEQKRVGMDALKVNLGRTEVHRPGYQPTAEQLQSARFWSEDRYEVVRRRLKTPMLTLEQAEELQDGALLFNPGARDQGQLILIPIRRDARQPPSLATPAQERLLWLHATTMATPMMRDLCSAVLTSAGVVAVLVKEGNALYGHWREVLAGLSGAVQEATVVFGKSTTVMNPMIRFANHRLLLAGTTKQRMVCTLVWRAPAKLTSLPRCAGADGVRPPHGEPRGDGHHEVPGVRRAARVPGHDGA